MIKPYEVIAIETQDQLNQLVEVMREFLEGGLAYDSIHIDEPYVAYVDEVLHIIPQSQIDTKIKSRKFSQWIQSVNNRKGKRSGFE